MNGGLLSLIQADMILDTFTIQTQDSIDIAREKLACQIGNLPSPFTINSTQVILYGDISEDGFRLCRLKGGSQSITIITGRFEALQSGAVIHLTVELNLSLIMVCLLFPLYFIIFQLPHIIKNTEGIISVVIIMMIVAIIICALSYKNEITYYRNKFLQVFS